MVQVTTWLGDKWQEFLCVHAAATISFRTVYTVRWLHNALAQTLCHIRIMLTRAQALPSINSI